MNYAIVRPPQLFNTIHPIPSESGLCRVDGHCVAPEEIPGFVRLESFSCNRPGFEESQDNYRCNADKKVQR